MTDPECETCGVELDGYELLELDGETCFNCIPQED